MKANLTSTSFLKNDFKISIFAFEFKRRVDLQCVPSAHTINIAVHLKIKLFGL
jgi:hypothetical protein